MTETSFLTHTLRNGLQVIGQRVAEVQTVAVIFSIQAGSRNEGDLTPAGVAHFLEHMAFRSSQTRSGLRLLQAFERIGADINAATFTDATRYYACALGEQLDQMLAFLCEMMAPRLLQDEFELEKAAILHEMWGDEEEPDATIQTLIRETCFQDSSLAHDILGTPESIQHTHLSHLRDFWEHQYVANNLLISVAVGLGLAQTLTGSFSRAIDSYMKALKICGEDARCEQLPDISYGLCDAYRHQGQCERALEYGKKVLQFSTERGKKQLECQVRHMLGRVYAQMGDFAASNSCYTESLILAVSVGSETMTLNTYTALADLRLAEEKPEEAWRYCEMALEYSPKVRLDSFVGMMYLVCGKVAEALSKGPEKQEQAISFYEKAVEKLQGGETGSEILSEAYRRLAQILEVSGQQDRALAYWRSAYAARDIGRRADQRGISLHLDIGDHFPLREDGFLKVVMEQIKTGHVPRAIDHWREWGDEAEELPGDEAVNLPSGRKVIRELST